MLAHCTIPSSPTIKCYPTLTLSDVRGRSLGIVCQPCHRRGRYGVARPSQEHGDARLTELIVTLAVCPMVGSGHMYDRCKAVYEGLACFKTRKLSR